MKQYLGSGENSEKIAAEIFKAAVDGRNRLRYLAGRGITAPYCLRKILPFGIFSKLMNHRFGISGELRKGDFYGKQD
mgnify:CR=1 FL=1